MTECQKFLKAADREKLLKEYKVCIYCVRHKYDYKRPCNSRSKLKCETCGGQHISAMHPQPEKASIDQSLTAHATRVVADSEEYFRVEDQLEAYLCKDADMIQPSSVTRFMATALVPILQGKQPSHPEVPIEPTRCMFDQCSQESFVSEHFVQTMGLKKTKIHAQVTGVGGNVGTTIRACVSLRIATPDPENPVIKFIAYVVKNVTSPNQGCPKEFRWKHDGRKLADPQFYKKSYIPVLLGFNVLPKLYIEGQTVADSLILQNAIFGWIVSGSDPGQSRTHNKAISLHVTLTELEQGC